LTFSTRLVSLNPGMLRVIEIIDNKASAIQTVPYAQAILDITPRLANSPDDTYGNRTWRNVNGMINAKAVKLKLDQNPERPMLPFSGGL